jgi:hypothetical protein
MKILILEFNFPLNHLLLVGCMEEDYPVKAKEVEWEEEIRNVFKL